MFNLLSGNSDKKNKKENSQSAEVKEARELFNIGRFPVVTTQIIENRPIAKVLGLVCCRGFDSDEAFFGMAAMAVKKGAQAIIGYNENVAFHPDGSKYFSCFGTAVMFEREGRIDFTADKRTIKETLKNIPTAPAPNGGYPQQAQHMQQMQQPMQSMQQVQQPVQSMQRSNEERVSFSNQAMQYAQKANYQPTEAPMENISLRDLENEFNSSNAMFDNRNAHGMPYAQNHHGMNGAQQMPHQQDMSHMHAQQQMHNMQSQQQMQGQDFRQSQKPSEEEDPVLQRLLAAQKRQANSQNWQH